MKDSEIVEMLRSLTPAQYEEVEYLASLVQEEKDPSEGNVKTVHYLLRSEKNKWVFDYFALLLGHCDLLFWLSPTCLMFFGKEQKKKPSVMPLRVGHAPRKNQIGTKKGNSKAAHTRWAGEKT